MNSTSILEQFVVKGKGLKERGWNLSSIVVIITAIFLLIVGLTAALSGNKPSVKISSPFELSQNPELMVAERYAQGEENMGEAFYEIANPELRLARQYGQAAIGLQGILTAHPNPELMLAQRYAPDWAANPELNLHRGYPVSREQLSLYPNPELAVAQRFAEEQVVDTRLTVVQKYAVMGIEDGGSGSAYENPEVVFARKYFEVNAPVPLQINPELVVAQRFAAVRVLNPELSMAEKYAIKGIEVGQFSTTYDNPELMAAQRFTSSGALGSLYSNPEVIFAGRFTKNWVINPELYTAARHTQATQSLDYRFLVSNPEIRLHLRSAGDF